MNYELRKNNILEKYETKTSQKPTQTYSSGKGSDSPGSFRYQRTRKINSGALSKTELPFIHGSEGEEEDEFLFAF